MSQFAKTFHAALDKIDSQLVLCLTTARDAFMGSTEKDRDIVLYLQADGQFLEKLIRPIGKARLQASQVQAILELSFAAIYSTLPITPGFVTTWIELVDGTSNLTNLEFDDATDVLRQGIWTLVCMISLEITQSAQTISLDDTALASESFLSSPDSLIRLHNHVLQMATGPSPISVVLSAWAIYLDKAGKSITDSGAEGPYQSFFDHVFSEESLDTSRSLMEKALQLGIYNEIMRLNESLPRKHQEAYKVGLLRLFLDLQGFIQSSNVTAVVLERLVTSRALSNICWQEPATIQLLATARQSFPFEHQLLLKIVRTLAYSCPQTMSFLESVPTFTQSLPVGFKDYDVVSSESGQTLIELTANLHLFAMRDHSKAIIVERGTRGLMIATKSGSLVLWQYTYSTLQYLFNILQTSASSLSTSEHADTLMDIIVLFTRLLQNDEYTSEFLRNLGDESIQSLSTTIFSIFEETLQSRGSTDLLITTIQYFDTILALEPSVAWPFVARMKFVDTLGSSITLGDYTAAIEVTGRACEFVGVICKLISSGLSEIVESALTLGEYLTKAKTLFFTDGVSFVLACSKSYGGWPVENTADKYNLGRLSSALFASIVHLAAETQLSACARTQHISHIVSRASQIVQGFLASGTRYDAPNYSMLRTALSQIEHVEPVCPEEKERFEESTFELYGVLIRASHAKVFPLRAICFQQLPMILRLWSRDKDNHRIVKLLLEILQNAGHGSSSILAALGDDKISVREDVLTHLKTIGSVPDTKGLNFWTLLECLLHQEQEGIALFMLESDGQDQCGTLLRVVADHVRNLDPLSWSPQLTTKILTVLLAAQNWAGTVHEQLKDSQDFWRKLYELCTTFNAPLSNQADELIIVHEAYRLIAAGLASKIIAAELLCLDARKRAHSDWAITPILTALPSSGVFEIKHYRASLHHNLSRNLSQKYPGFSLAALREPHTSIDTYGESFLHDMKLATRMVKANSFLRELRIANFNLTTVDAQGYRMEGLQVLIAASTLTPISSTESWLCYCSLACQLLSKSVEVPRLKHLTHEMVSTATAIAKSLRQAEKYSSPDGYLTLLEAFSSKDAEIANTETIDTLRLREQALSEFLQVLQTHACMRAHIPQYQRQLLSIFDRVVCARTLHSVELLRRALDRESIEDMGILVVIGRQLAALVKIHQLPVKSFGAILLQSNVIEGLVGLFFSLRQSTHTDLAIQCAYTILQQLSMLHEVTLAADQLMHGGLIRLFLESDLCIAVQQSSSPSTSTLNSLWLDGILPLILCVTNTLGIRIKDDLEIFIQAFSARIGEAFSRWTRPARIDVSMTQELILVVLLVGTYDNMLPVPDEGYMSTRQDLSARLEYLLQHPKTTSALSVVGDSDQSIFNDLQTALDIINDGAAASP